MIDENFKVWLIEVNTNPCLEVTCPTLSKIIPTLVENLFRFKSKFKKYFNYNFFFFLLSFQKIGC